MSLLGLVEDLLEGPWWGSLRSDVKTTHYLCLLTAKSYAEESTGKSLIMVDLGSTRILFRSCMLTACEAALWMCCQILLRSCESDAPFENQGCLNRFATHEISSRLVVYFTLFKHMSNTNKPTSLYQGGGKMTTSNRAICD